MKQRRIDEIRGIILFALGILVLASLVSYTPNDLVFYTSHPNVPTKNFVRIFGAYLSGILFFFFGWSSYLLTAFIFVAAIKKLKSALLYMRFSKVAALVLLLLSISSILAMIGRQQPHIRFSRSGILGSLIAGVLVTSFGPLGSFVILITLSLLCTIIISESVILPFVARFIDILKLKLSAFFVRSHFKSRIKPKPEDRNAVLVKKEKVSEIISDRLSALQSAPKIKIKAPPSSETKINLREVKIGDYHLPSSELLEPPPPLSARQIKEDLTANARILEETLFDFGVSVKVADIERGPVITRYELEPAPGVKVQRIVTLCDDIALAMKAQSVRIVAPIPGKGRVGVEVPNTQTSIVYIKELLSSQDFIDSSYKLTLALGKDITGNPVIADLGEMPHLLIAGTTGSGKTVCVNSLIASILYKATPYEVKFLMVDPKMVELAPFNGLPHLLCPVITEAKKVSTALNWVVNEMEERYQLLAKVGVRNIEAYNEKQETLPYIVVIIDELADLMVIAQQQIESAITRLAQLSRAVGIHLILATQRPSVDVITGVIKANFPARVSFKVASKVDSRTVLDMNGADKLLGRGDMLFLKPGESKPIRAQGSLIQDKEIERIVNFIKSQAEPSYNEEILIEKHKSYAASGEEKDELFDEAVRVILESNQASVSILQRRMRLGYTRAARLIDSMEVEGIVGAYQGSKPRKILVNREEWLSKYNNGNLTQLT